MFVFNSVASNDTDKNLIIKSRENNLANQYKKDLI